MVEKNLVVQKVWGEEEVLVNTPLYCAKYLYVTPGFVCSEHRHLIKDETFVVIAGNGAIIVSGKIERVHPGDSVHIPPGTYHRFATLAGMTLLEVSTHHSDNDVERLQESHRLGTCNSDVYLIVVLERE